MIPQIPSKVGKSSERFLQSYVIILSDVRTISKELYEATVHFRTKCNLSCIVVDLDSLNPDPDPAFQVNPDPRFWWPKIEEKMLKKFYYLFLSKNFNLLILMPPMTSKQQEEPYLLTFFYFCGSFLPSWIRIQFGSGCLTLLLCQYFLKPVVWSWLGAIKYRPRQLQERLKRSLFFIV